MTATRTETVRYKAKAKAVLLRLKHLSNALIYNVLTRVKLFDNKLDLSGHIRIVIFKETLKDFFHSL